MIRRFLMLLAAATLWFGAMAQRTDHPPVGSAQIEAFELDDLAPVLDVVITDVPVQIAPVRTLFADATAPDRAPPARYLTPLLRPPRTFA